MITSVGYNLVYLGYNVYLYSNVIYYGYYGYYGYYTLSNTVKKIYNIGKRIVKREDIKEEWIML
tara:strand:- start:33 stop:224 length:192 start_codon:yes stop_codon:yes gene_type:complete